MSKKTLNTTNLETLGAARLAALLMEVSTGSADIKRRLRLELSHNLGASELAHDVRKRLAAIRKSTSYVGWRKRKALIKDLGTQASMITDKTGADDPTQAFDLLWQFIELAPSVYARVDDSRGDVGDVFRNAATHLDVLGPRAQIDAATLAERVWTALLDNDYGQWDGVIERLAETLGAEGLDHLKRRIADHATEPADHPPPDTISGQFLHQLRGGTQAATERRARFAKTHLQEIAAATGDTQGYIALFTATDLHRKDTAAEIALLLLNEGQAAEALQILKGAQNDDNPHGQAAWDDAMIAVLSGLGHDDAAQTHRWTSFTQTLNADHLRGYLKGLPDFEDIDAEDRARDILREHPHFSQALHFCLHWPDLTTAAQMIEARWSEINGNHYALLVPVSEALRLRHPLAAVLLWRAMIDYALDQGIPTRYGHAADHLIDCARLDVEIVDYGPHPDHADYLHGLQVRHDRKASFWSKLR